MPLLLYYFNMSNICPFCETPVSSIKLQHFVLRICPKCYSTFFPAKNTMSFRSDVSDKTRESWLSVLKSKDVKDPVLKESLKCIDHGEPLVKGSLPDYGIDGYVTTCCEMFHLPPSLTCQILERTLKFPFHATNKSKHTKEHFFFIHLFDRILSKIIGEKPSEEDPLDLIQYDLHFKDILGPKP